MRGLEAAPGRGIASWVGGGAREPWGWLELEAPSAPAPPPASPAKAPIDPMASATMAWARASDSSAAAWRRFPSATLSASMRWRLLIRS